MTALPNELGEVLRTLGASVSALGDHINEIVLVGGVAVALYRRSVTGANPRTPPLMTFDIDMAVPEQFQSPHEPCVHDKLTRAGFSASCRGSGEMPITQYHRSSGDGHSSPIYLEFIAPRRGGAFSRAGKGKSVIQVERDLHAQTDPYVGLLLYSNRLLHVSHVPEMLISGDVSIRLPNPILYVLQKALIRKNRNASKQDNDAGHIYDIALTTRPVWQSLAKDLVAAKECRVLSKTWFKNAQRTLDDMFASDMASGSIGAAAVFKTAVGDQSPSAAAVYRVVRTFLEETGVVT